jgi:DNA repair exonuclease SbcCD ATPase subunit
MGPVLMTTAPTDMPTCLCGHSHAEHEPLAPQCSAARCECIRYRPNRTPPRVLTVAPAPIREVAKTITIEHLLTIGRRSDHKRIAALAEKITAELEDLRRRVADQAAAQEAERAAHAERAKVLTEIAALEAKLTAAKARLKKRGARPALDPPGTEPGQPGVQCPVCGRTFKTLGRHAATHREQPS